MDPRNLHPMRAVLAAMLAAGVCASVQAQDGDGTPSAAQRYQAERAACLSGHTHQSRSTCLEEANAAYAQARRGGGSTADASDFDENRFARCEPLPELEQRACIARMHGAGTSSGSVDDGGIYRELVITLPADDADRR